jgi:biopolymer transport protein ExbD
MKFPRNAKLYRGQLDVAPWVGVFFLLVVFLLLNSSLVFTPGVKVNLPEVGLSDFPGTENPALTVVIDLRGEIYFDQRTIPLSELRDRLRDAVRQIPGLTLVIQADKAADVERWVQLCKTARDVGVRNVVLAVRPVLSPAHAVSP